MEAVSRGRVIEYVDELLGDPQWKLLLALGLAEPAAGIAATGKSTRGPVIALWNPPHVVILAKAPAGVWGSVHCLTGNMTLRLHAVNKEPLGQAEITWSVKQAMPAIAISAVATAGLSAADPFDL